MGVVKEVVDYEVPRRPVGRAQVMAGLFVLAQVVWFYPAVFATWWVLCDTGRIQTPAGEFAGAFVVCAPSFGAAWCGTRGAIDGNSSPSRRAFAAAAALVGAAVIALAFGGAVRELLHPSPFPCP